MVASVVSFSISVLHHLQVRGVRLTLTNAPVIHVNMVQHVRIKLMDLPAAVQLDSQVNSLPALMAHKIYCGD